MKDINVIDSELRKEIISSIHGCDHIEAVADEEFSINVGKFAGEPRNKGGYPITLPRVLQCLKNKYKCSTVSLIATNLFEISDHNKTMINTINNWKLLDNGKDIDLFNQEESTRRSLHSLICK